MKAVHGCTEDAEVEKTFVCAVEITESCRTRDFLFNLSVCNLVCESDIHSTNCSCRDRQ